MQSQLGVRFYQAAERLFGQGQLLWFGIRKRWFADEVERSLVQGARQLLVVGAGFDALAVLSAHRHPGALCVEIDGPATADLKRVGVRSAGLERSNHVVVGADLASTPLAAALRATPWRSDLPSVIVAEGLLMYLEPAQVTAFFSQVRGCAPAGSRIAFSSVDQDGQGRPRVSFDAGVLNRMIQGALRLAGEAMHWGIQPSAVPNFLKSLGYRVIEQPASETLRQRFLHPLGLADEPLAPYEHLVLAEIAGASA
jgi:methyltransferase (TIGR00027 family)